MPGDLKVSFDFRESDHTISLCAVEEDFDMNSEVLRDMDLTQVLERIPAFVEESRAKWAVEPKFPAYKKPRAKKTTGKAAAPASDAAPAPEKPAEAAPADGSSTVTVTAGDLPLLSQPAENEPASPETGDTGQVTAEEPPAESPAGQEIESGGDWPGGYEDEAPDPNLLPEEGVKDMTTPSEAEAQAPATQNGNGGETPATQNGNGAGKWSYTVTLEGEEKSFDHPHAALLALGVTQEDIDGHKYWHRHDRLPKKYQEQIQKVRGD